MLRLLALVFLVSACSADAAPPAPVADAPKAVTVAGVALPMAPPRNLVCERLALENSKAPCVPELTDAGELHTHTARITIDGQVIVCALNSSQVSAVCGPMFAAVRQEAEFAGPVRTKKPAPKAGAKK
jgi:hypothetical protein